MTCQRCNGSRIMEVTAKCSDRCFVKLDGEQHDGYVPTELGIGSGDAIELEVCMDCGQLQGKWPNHNTLEEEEEFTGKYMGPGGFTMRF